MSSVQGQRIILIDNYDSFSYNLYQLVGSIDPKIDVIRNDELSVSEIAARDPRAIIISPGPGRPEDSGVCIDVIRKLGPKTPIFGVCLGCQAICTAFGTTVGYAKRLMHGKQSVAELDRSSVIFAGMPERTPVARYHSLAAAEETLTPELRITARADDGEIMAVEHREFPIYGVQFHPESIMTPEGGTMMQNFLKSS